MRGGLYAGADLRLDGENLTLIADTSISGARVARELDALVRIYGKPGCIVSDNGTEFTSKAILKWAWFLD